MQENFTKYLTRTTSVLGVSLWEYWYRSNQFKDITGLTFSEGIFFGKSTPAHAQEYMFRCFRDATDLTRMKDAFFTVVTEKPKDALELLRIAHQVYVQYDKAIDEEKDPGLLLYEYADIDEVFDTYVTIGVYTAIAPYFWFGVTDPTKTEYHQEIQDLCTSLRSTSLYPRFYNKVVLPYLELKTGCTREDLSLFMFNEVRALFQSGDASVFESAIQKRKETGAGKDCIYKIVDGVVSLEYIPRDEFKKKESSVFTGVVVSSGDGKSFKGKVKVIYGNEDMESDISDIDILLSIHASPTHKNWMKHAKVVLCEEGGSACHAAYMSEDKEKIVIMGLTDILDVVKDGDELLVHPATGEVELVV